MLTLKDTKFSYRKKEILHGVTLSFEKEKFTALIGPNGSGKTTLLRLAAGIIQPSCGEVTVLGEALSALSTKERAKRISYLPQGRSLPEMTVGELVLCGRFAYTSFPSTYSEEDRHSANEAIVRVGLSEHTDTLLSELSGGMRQCAYIAMSLASGSDFILLDEPTTYLDIRHELELMNLLTSLKDEGKGIVAVLHDLPLAFEYADTVAVLSRGSLVDIGSPSDVISRGRLDEVFGVRFAHAAGHQDSALEPPKDFSKSPLESQNF